MQILFQSKSSLNKLNLL